MLAIRKLVTLISKVEIVPSEFDTVDACKHAGSTVGRYSTDYVTIAHFTPFTERMVEGEFNLSSGDIFLPIEVLINTNPLRLGTDALGPNRFEYASGSRSINACVVRNNVQYSSKVCRERACPTDQ